MADAEKLKGLDCGNTSSSDDVPKVIRNGITLYPQPSDDPADPLNWSMTKKLLTLCIVTLAGFIGLTQTLAANSGFFVQAELYGKTAVELSYGVSSGIVGLAVGPLLWSPLAQRIGRTSCIFWGMILAIICSSWSAVMTGEEDYNNFVVSRFFASLFGSVGTTLGGGIIIDIFFLHQRGKTFMIYLAILNLGTAVGPTLSGYIITTAPWPVQIWWTVAVQGVVVLLTFFFLQDTGYPRSSEEKLGERPTSWLADRRATLLPGNRIMIQTNRPAMSPWSSIIIGVCPITLLAGLILTVDFGWLVAQNTLLSVFLQSPVEEGGYNFTPSQNASFQFSQWVGIFTAIAYGYFVNDRLPLWICKRRGSIWRPEYRLYPSLVPAIVGLPVALGLFGACLQHRLHYMVLALASYLTVVMGNGLTPVVTSYVVESFTGFAAETTTILNFYRLLLGLLVPFFVRPWENTVSPGWLFGMMAIFSLICSSIIPLFIWRGPAIRQLSFSRFKSADEGVDLGAH